MRYLLAVDVQPEFVKGIGAKAKYDKVVNFIRTYMTNYTVIAPVYQNKGNPNMHRLLAWDEMREIAPIEFKPDMIYLHSGYSIKEYPAFNPGDSVDVVGADTDACVLSACFDLFNLGVAFRIIEDGCWSSGGQAMHRAALKIMERQFGKALNMGIKL